ncbi:DUF7059 domain-containing protein [Paeniglutamicibacter cryotolerans]|uniref:Methylase of polypeptide subunit release factors n=1 Tax=Paeniglutamicibacter cryotolerans TaxID=670079 RepID=A0A839QF00_9MICC|nr:methyltransferase [Paeniglutamicibacter cryotolerans]MBB2994217.1 methylase of polypeptide subunit release factors [Paeniglutamicibacter cryotolerans]
MIQTPEFSAISDAPRSTDQSLLDALAADLRAAEFGHDAISALLGPEANAALHRDQLVPALLVLRGAYAAPRPAALAVQLGLWMLGREFDADALDAAFPVLRIAGLVELGLIEQSDSGNWRASVDLRPHASDADAELWVASDPGAHQRTGVLRHDHVLGIGQASLTLAQITVRPQVERALDLGTGCGIQLFHLLAHARTAVATDISERALAFTRFNLLLNHAALGLDPADLGARVQLRLGSLLEPVAGEEFDLVVSNPPFVITPRRSGESTADQYTYRDGGLPGDRLVAELIAGIPSVLRPGGVAQMLANWEIGAKPDIDAQDTDEQEIPAWQLGPRSWLDPATEAWFIQRETATPSEYAETWLRDSSESRDPEAYAEHYEQYLDDFASRSVAAVGFGMVWLRRPENSEIRPLSWRFEEIGYPIEQPVGQYLAAAVAAADLLAASDLGSEHLLVAEDVTEERHQRPGAEHPGVILLRQGAGLRRTELLSTELAGFVSACDGDLSVDQLVGALDSLLGDGDPDFVDRLHDGVSRLVTRGFLLQMRNKR